MRNLYRKSLLLFTALLSSASLALAQTGVIWGDIVDEEQGLALPGANIILSGINKSAISEPGGNFEIANVPPGTYQLTVSYMGYQSFSTSIEVKENEITPLELLLKSGIQVGNEVLVLGDRLKGQAKALNEQLSNANITNIVSADQVGRFPDANIGDAMKRIPGITMLNNQGEARFGVIRGTQPYFNSVMINGERIPSADEDTRSVQLDLVPTDMIQIIEVNKTLTPDMDADAIGGSVNLITRTAPKKMRVSGTLGSGYNFLANKPIYLGSLVVGNRFLKDRLGVIVSGSLYQHNFGSHNAQAQWDKSPLDKGGVDYITELDIRKYTVQRTRQSGSVSLDYLVGKSSVLTLRTLYNVRDDYENRYRILYSGMGQPAANGLTTGRVEVETKGGSDDTKNARLERQKMNSTMLSGEHSIGSKVKLTWAGTYANASQDRPGESYLSFRSKKITLQPNTGSPEFPGVQATQSLEYESLPFRRFQYRNDFTSEQDINGKMDALILLSSQEAFSNSLKIGVRYRNKEKSVVQMRGELKPEEEDQVIWSAIAAANYSDDNFLANGSGTQYLVGFAPTKESLGSFGRQFNTTYEADTDDNLSASFEANEQITGSYAMFNQNLGQKLSIIAGARLEHTKVKFDAHQILVDEEGESSATPTSGTHTYLNVMPAFHAKYLWNTNTVLRAAWTNTLARPNYIDLAPSRSVDLSEQALVQGNPGLKATTAMNFDLMAEHYFKSVGIVSGGIFHKDISNFVYTYTLLNYTDPTSGNVFNTFSQPLNGSAASLTGLELAFQRQLNFLPGMLKGLGVYANYTYTTSQVDNFPGREGLKTPLPGTAKHNLNGSLSFETSWLVIRASVNYHSSFAAPEEAPITLSDGSTVFRYLDKQTQVDLNASYLFMPKFRFFVEVNNLTNQPLRYYQDNSSRTAEAEYYNVRANAGIKFDL